MYLEEKTLSPYILSRNQPKLHYVSGGSIGKNTCDLSRNQGHRRSRLALRRSDYRASAANEQMLEAEGIFPTVITSDAAHRDTKRRVIEHLKGAEEEGEVLLVTWNA